MYDHERHRYWGGYQEGVGRSGPHYGKGPKGYQRSDERIKDEVNERLYHHPDVDASEIEVSVTNGEVVLSGTVPGRRMKHLAEDLTDDIVGVREVSNRLRVVRREEQTEDEDEQIAVYGIFPNRDMAERVVDELLRSGFSRDDISFLAAEQRPGRFGSLGMDRATKMPEGISAGVGTGSLIGGALGFLAGIGALMIPGIGPLVAAGPVMSLLAGMGVGGAVGGVTGALVGLGIPEYEAKRYEGMIARGGVLISVHCRNHNLADRASEVLRRTGAHDVDSRSESSADDSGGWYGRGRDDYGRGDYGRDDYGRREYDREPMRGGPREYERESGMTGRDQRSPGMFTYPYPYGPL